MPELPEVETVRRSLDVILNHTITSARALRPDIFSPHSPSPDQLLLGARITSSMRTGKRLALIADDGRAIDFHLGMSGKLLLYPDPYHPLPAHTHGHWTLLGQKSRLCITLAFVDPRRFGHVRLHPSPRALKASWSSLGPDALTITPDLLSPRLANTSRPLKAALLDQQLLAGLGNIYADESCFQARLSPHRPADSLSPADLSRLCEAVRAVLQAAIDLGGSTLKDKTYVNAQGASGSAQSRHAVYARADQPCKACSRPLLSSLISARTTTWCGHCQS